MRRVVVVIDAAAPARAALEAAAALAAAANAELLALFVEDLDLLHVAALPFARELGDASAVARELDDAVMRRALRACADDARRAMEHIARRVPLHWTFQVARDVLDAEALAAAATADVVIEALRGSARAALQLAEIARASRPTRLVRARTARELAALRRAPTRRD